MNKKHASLALGFFIFLKFFKEFLHFLSGSFPASQSKRKGKATAIAPMPKPKAKLTSVRRKKFNNSLEKKQDFCYI